ncbi:nSTAND1 domain-containing NTPase [Mycobacterium sp. 050134]|uniref:nSTAND1 domain-containing NTPase n=1 Tax=Mycobacterium sp. 050134 TaxID=3096111 RepID=UPI002EDB08C2
MAAAASAAQQQLYPGASAVTVQRVSDWRRGSRVPQRFESVETVLRVLIGEAQRRNAPPAMAGMYDIGRWRRWWSEARTASAADATDRRPRMDGAPSTICPYQGLASFGAVDSARFFGRARTINELVALIAKVQGVNPGIVLLTGASGAGKSSLLSAGLISAACSGALEIGTPMGGACQSVSDSDGGWVSARMTPGNEPMTQLQRCLDQPDIQGRAEGVRLLMIVDQGEELFTLDACPQSRAEFVGALHAMSQPSMSAPSAVVIMALRSDVLGRCVELPVLATAVQSRCMVLGPMNRAELRDVIVEPAKTAGLRIESGLVDLILNDVGVEECSVEAARLPLLSHVLAGTWLRRRVGKLTIAGYRAAGGLRGSVAATGEHAWSQLDAAQRKIARRMLMRLVAIGEAGHDGCRREPKQALLARFADAEDAADVLEMLTSARLLTIHDSDVTFTHEIVLRAWPRLAAWIDDDRANAPMRQRAEDDAAAWIKNGQNRSFLQRGARLVDTLALLADDQDVDHALAEFVKASLQHKRLVTRSVRAAAVLLIILTVVCASVAVVAIRQRSAIARQYSEAIFNQVLAAADERLLIDPSLSAQLLMVAQQLRPNNQVRSRLVATENAPLATQLTGHSGQVATVRFSPDGNLLASASWDNTIRLWDTSDPNDPRPVGQPLRGHTSFVTSVAFSPDGKTLASSSGDKTVRLWDLTRPRDVKMLTEPLTGDGAFYMVAFSPDGRTLAAPNDDRTVRLWDVTNRRAPHAGPILSGHTGPVRAIAFSSNGHTLASASNDKTVRLWDVTDPTRVQQMGPPLTGFTNIAHAVAFDPASRLLAATGEDGVIRLWNVTNPARPIRLADPLAAHNEASWSLEFSPDGTTLASASYDGMAKLWNVLDPSNPIAFGQPLTDASSGLTSVTFRPDGHYLATSGTSGAVSLWTLPTGLIPNHLGRINSPAFSANGKVMVTASDNIIQLWTNPNRLIRAATLHLPDNSGGGYEYEARVNASGTIMATEMSSTPTVLWDISDIAKPVELSMLPNKAKYTNVVAFSHDEHTVATASDDYTLQLWDITDPKRPQPLSEPLTGFTGFINAVTFSPDARTVIAGSADGTVRAWDITDRHHPQPSAAAITGHTGAVVSLSVSPDGKTLATGSQDQTIWLWDITNPLHAAPIGHPLQSRSDEVQIAFSPDGKTLASGSDDGSVLLWDITDQTKPVAVGDSLVPPRAASRTRVTFDPHGRLYAASRNATLRIWKLNTDNATKRICASTRNVLTPQQWSQILRALPYDPPCQRAAFANNT